MIDRTADRGKVHGASLLMLGLTATEERIYRHCLRNPGTLGEDLHVLLHVPRDKVETAQERLFRLGLLQGDRTAVLAADPKTAVGRLTDLRLRVLHEQLPQVTQARHLVADPKAEQGPAPSAASAGAIAGCGSRYGKVAAHGKGPDRALRPARPARSRAAHGGRSELPS
ncbi:hypothetical protein AW27_014740 [Streptomyces sp. PCS3-D2]|uniref:hypothetical protein n=1 Tax=Streptomyces sp. PCS3-D2 TaxID=1460244 RepID=UPI0012FF0A32|nr:hypothetical protein [Streptomyces sp. PCS3-D2]WKV72670.1 hypothetical protein AW27_014740 [Streptomyces sp. PCS3-D2]